MKRVYGDLSPAYEGDLVRRRNEVFIIHKFLDAKQATATLIARCTSNDDSPWEPASGHHVVTLSECYWLAGATPVSVTVRSKRAEAA